MATRPSPVRTRRRGEHLEHALYVATLSELADVGYDGLTMERIAARAGTGKAALYRRWPGKRDLVLAALRYGLPPLPTPSPKSSTRDSLLAMFTAHCSVLAGKTGFPRLDVIGQLIHEPELRAIIADELIAPRLRIINKVLENGVSCGEINPACLTPLTAKIGPALIIQHALLTGAPPTRRELARIVDTVIATSTRRPLT